MRHIGTIAEQKQAERFVHFLDAQQIEATLRPLQVPPVLYHALGSIV